MIYKPQYLDLFKSGGLLKRVEEAEKIYQNCGICPHNCHVNRKEEVGFCKAKTQAIVASYGPHFGEERVLVGTNGSGTIFFSFCNLRCIFCQNYDLSHYGRGREVSDENLAEMMLALQKRYRCHNVNLVTPTHFVPNILRALYIAVKKGFNLPLVYNCGGYESFATLKLLAGVIDIYMPDFKYLDSNLSLKYSKVKDYPEIVKKAIKEMDYQVGGLMVDSKNIAYRGLLIRHLMLPGALADTKDILDFIKSELSVDVYLNLMDQYYPAYQAFSDKDLNRRLSYEEYQEGYKYAKKLNLRLDKQI